jgi:nanoRNase/pAp phosphatase (c-di-AMP/oligoRNAs hydrolase)
MDEKHPLACLLEQRRGEKHLVVLHEYPDPDAISSAFAHQAISAEYNIETDIVYAGKISHNQNIALVKLLGIDLAPYEEGLDLSQYHGAVFLDNQGTTVNGITKALISANVPILIVVDHHEPQGNLVAAYTDIQKTGSTATIYARYIEQGMLSLQKDRKEHVAIATALLHGIITDTAGFNTAGKEDFQAAAYLSQFRDPDLLEQIMNQARSKQVMEVINRALGNRIVVENLSIAGVGYLRSDDRDAIPQVADFLMQEENVHTAIVYGILKDEDGKEALTGSLRTSKLTLDPNKFLKEAFGVSPEGNHYGGGKHMAGGFSIPVGFLAGEPCENYAALKWQAYDIQVKAKIFSKLGIGSEQPCDHLSTN